MGGISTALRNDSARPYYINSSNPASYISTGKFTTYEAGVSVSMLQLKSESSKQTVNSASIAYLAFAMPVLPKYWAISFGLQPYSSVGYKVSDHKTLDSIGNVDYLYEGSGGINRVYFGNTIQPFGNAVGRLHETEKFKNLQRQKEAYRLAGDQCNFEKLRNQIYHMDKRKQNLSTFSAGLNASFLFGNLESTRRVLYPNNSSNQFYYNTKNSRTMRIKDFSFDYGVQQTFRIDSMPKKGKWKLLCDSSGNSGSKNRRELKEKVRVTLGATFGMATDLNAKRDILSFSYFTTATGYEVPKDTMENFTAQEGTVSLPMSGSAGIVVKKGERWLIGADYSFQNWSEFSSFGESSSDLKNSMRISLGGQYTPNKASEAKGSYWKKVQYRAGLKYYNTYLDLKDTRLTESSVSLGLGLPVGFRTQFNYSVLNLGFEIGQRGTSENGLVKEQFYRAVIGLTINDKWFQKPKFD